MACLQLLARLLHSSTENSVVANVSSRTQSVGHHDYVLRECEALANLVRDVAERFERYCNVVAATKRQVDHTVLTGTEQHLSSVRTAQLESVCILQASAARLETEVISAKMELVQAPLLPGAEPPLPAKAETTSDAAADRTSLLTGQFKTTGAAAGCDASCASAPVPLQVRRSSRVPPRARILALSWSQHPEPPIRRQPPTNMFLRPACVVATHLPAVSPASHM
jgi:hypothetical protein